MPRKIFAVVGLVLVGSFFLLMGSSSQGFYHQKKEKAQEVQVTAKEWAIEPREIKVKGGEVKFIITNRGSFPHAFSIQGQGVDKKSEMISPGKNASLAVNLNKAGEYLLFCPVPGHKEQGMAAKLRVTQQGRGE